MIGDLGTRLQGNGLATGEAAVKAATEAGFPDYNMIYWFGMMAPAGLPPTIKERLGRALAAVAADPGFAEKMIAAGGIAEHQDAAAMLAQMNNDLHLWRQLVGVLPKVAPR